MMNNFTRLLLVVLLAGWQLTALAANVTVNVSDFQYSPQGVTINVGDQVTWQWISGNHPTQSASTPAAWATFPMDANNQTFTMTFNTAGVYPYYCQVHGFSMGGVIQVIQPTGIKENKLQEPFLLLYPNPATELVKINLKVKGSETYQIRLTNVLGETISVIPDATIKATSGENIKVDLQHLPGGLYFFSFYVNDKIMDTRRLVLEK